MPSMNSSACLLCWPANTSMPSGQMAHGLEPVTAGNAKGPAGATGGTGGEVAHCSYCSGDGGKVKESGHQAIGKQVSLVLLIPRLAVASVF